MFSETRLAQINERLKERRPAPGDYDPDRYNEHYQRIKQKNKDLHMKLTLRLYDPNFGKQKLGKLRAQALIEAPGPLSYCTKKNKSSKLGTFQKEITKRGPLELNNSVSPNHYDPMKTLSMCSSLENLK